MKTLEVCECFKETEDGLLRFYVSICVNYLDNKRPILTYSQCRCDECNYFFNYLYRLEKENFINILESDLLFLSIVPRNIKNTKTKDTSILCMCNKHGNIYNEQQKRN